MWPDPFLGLPGLLPNPLMAALLLLLLALYPTQDL